MDEITTNGGALRRRKRKKRSLSDDKENAVDEGKVCKPCSKTVKKRKKSERRVEKDKSKKTKTKKRSDRGSSSSKKSKPVEAIESNTSLTSNAVESLVSFAQFVGKDKPPLPENLVVRICRDDETLSNNTVLVRSSQDQTVRATLDDGTHTLPVVLLEDARNEALQIYLKEASELAATGAVAWILVAVRGLIATDGHNPKYPLDPIICLTAVDVLSDTPLLAKPSGTPYRLPKRPPTLPQSPPPSQQHSSNAPPASNSTVSVRAGTVGTFLDQTLPFWTNEEFLRCHDTSTQRLILSEPFSTPTVSMETSQNSNQSREDMVQASIAALNQHAEQVQTFATRHAAMMTLQASSQPTEQAVQNYTSALREFASSQLDRQKASLASNAGREAADRANLVTSQYIAALEQATEIATPDEDYSLTPERLIQWHKTLLQDLNPEAGQIRSKTVRAGHTAFCRPKEITTELDKFCLALTHLQDRLQLGRRTEQRNSGSTSTPDAWHVILFAAVAMYGIVDIHPFADGNGRMSRIVANWALLRSFPFTINIFATPAQRAEYILALETTRHLLSMSNQKKVYGNVSLETRLQVVKSVGIFAPLVRLLMDRMGRAVVEFHRVWEEKSGLVAEALESKAARQARERAKEGTCIICLDENPNIATLCCGKAVHLNCIAEWLSGKNSCPCCRSEMPSISGRVVRAARGENIGASGEGGDGNAVSPSSRRLQRRYFQNAQDVIVSLLSNYNENQNTTTETAYDDAYGSGNDTTTGVIDEDDPQQALLDEDDEQSESSFYDSSDEGDDSDSDGGDSAVSDEVHSARQALRSTSRTGSSVDGFNHGARYNDGGASIEHGENLSSGMTSDTTNADDEEDSTQALPLTRVHEFCDALYCRNRPAVDCTNNLCGRCCVLGGEFHCPRHNS